MVIHTLYSGINLPQVVGDLQQEDLFAVPWGHHRLIIDRCKDDYEEAAGDTDHTCSHSKE